MAASLLGVVFVWMMTSGPAIVVPAARTLSRGTGSSSAPAATTRSGKTFGEPLSAGQSALRQAEASAAARASGLHETSAPGAVSAAYETPPSRGVDRRRSVRRTIKTNRFWILFAGAVAIGIFDEGILQAFLPAAVAEGVRSEVAAAALSVQALAYVAGQVLGGWLSDRFGRRLVGLAAAVLVAGGVVAALGLIASQPARRGARARAPRAGDGRDHRRPLGDLQRRLRRRQLRDDLRTAGRRIPGRRGAGGLPGRGGLRRHRARTLLLIPVVLVAVAVWAVSLWVAGPRRSRTANARA